MGFDIECIPNIQSLAGEYFCPVCRLLVYPNEAHQSMCTHLYCKPCLTYISSTTRACPYDGYLVTEADSKPLLESNKELADTIGSIKVQCLYQKSGCTWTGSLSESSSHCSGCVFGNSLVVCNKCGAQIVHCQVLQHAQVCPQIATSGKTAVGDQTQAVPAPNSEALPVASATSTAEQWYQQQYQQHYQSYPGYYPYQQPGVTPGPHQQFQSPAQSAPASGQHQAPLVYPQAKLEPQNQNQTLIQIQLQQAPGSVSLQTSTAQAQLQQPIPQAYPNQPHLQQAQLPQYQPQLHMQPSVPLHPAAHPQALQLPAAFVGHQNYLQPHPNQQNLVGLQNNTMPPPQMQNPYPQSLAPIQKQQPPVHQQVGFSLHQQPTAQQRPMEQSSLVVQNQMHHHGSLTHPQSHLRTLGPLQGLQKCGQNPQLHQLVMRSEPLVNDQSAIALQGNSGQPIPIPPTVNRAETQRVEHHLRAGPTTKEQEDRVASTPFPASIAGNNVKCTVEGPHVQGHLPPSDTSKASSPSSINNFSLASGDGRLKSLSSDGFNGLSAEPAGRRPFDDTLKHFPRPSSLNSDSLPGAVAQPWRPFHSGIGSSNPVLPHEKYGVDFNSRSFPSINGLRERLLGHQSIGHSRLPRREFEDHNYIRVHDHGMMGPAVVPGHIRGGDQLFPHGFSDISKLEEQIRLNGVPRRPGDPGFRSRYSLRGFPNSIRAFPIKGDVEPLENPRKRNQGASWCRICKVDCETSEGLDDHTQTNDHLKNSMDIVLMIKQNAKKYKSEDNTRTAASEGHDSKNKGMV